MRKALPLLFLALALPAFAQTTYTTTENGCNGKQFSEYCIIPTDSGTITIDNRAPYRIGYLEIGTTWYHGAYSGFVPCDYGVRSCAGTSPVTYVSDDGTVHGSFNYFAQYQGSCQGRNCGVVGWHYTFLSGSTVTVQ